MIEDVVCLIKSFQTLTVGIVGFLGLIYTVNSNSKISRQQVRSNQSHERSVFRQAIYCELKMMKGAFEGRLEKLKDNQNSGIIIPKIIRTRVYDSLQSKIGLLTVKEIAPIIRAYILIDELSSRLQVLSGQSEEVVSHEDYFYIDARFVDKTYKLHGNFLESINEALDAIKIESVS